MTLSTRLTTGGLVGVILAATLVAPTGVASAAVVIPAKTSALEARRVDRVATPKLDWYRCYGYAECATARLPLDYDKPNGATTELAVLRVKATDQKNKIGSLFINPGGPGGQGTEIAYFAPDFLSDSVLARFDVVGVDPRGVGFSDAIQCFPSAKEQSAAYTGLQIAFPYGKKQDNAFVASAKAVGKGCSTTGKKLAGAMSTAEVARDMDVLRRAVGDKKLTYLGFSYGSVLGQYYANMFPDRFRAVAIDGVVDPTKWVGSTKTQEIPVFDRLRSADASAKAFREILVRCDRAGGTRCAFADDDPVKRFDTLVKRIRATPIVIEDAFGPITITYADLVVIMLSVLYAPDGSEFIAGILDELYTLSEPAAPAARAAAEAAVAARIRKADTGPATLGFPYDNSLEAFAGVACTDTGIPKDAGQFPALAAKADARAQYFGRPWAWNTAMCARNTWTVQDEDAYRGPFTKRTVKPVLVVGNHWDPATSYSGAVAAARLLPNSRLLSSNSWGHTAYGSSACVTKAIDTYLLKGTLPAKGKVCTGDLQPFAALPMAAPAADAARTTRPGADGLVQRDRPAPGTPKQLPPVVTTLPSADLTRIG